jgi:archaellum component FlaF (FlaF/FlaG flagellin family)
LLWTGTINPNSNNLTLGKNLSGMLDEVRVSSVARSANWVNTSFNSMNDPAGFLRVEEEQTQSYTYLNFTMENTGETDLETDQFTLLVNGENTEFIAMKAYLYVQCTMTMVANVTSSGTKRCKVITGNGIADYEEITL